MLHVYASDFIDKSKILLNNNKLITSFHFIVIPQPSAASWSNKREYEDILDGIASIIEECPDAT